MTDDRSLWYAECPKCGCRRVEMQVVAWWKFWNGEPVGHGYSALEDAPNGWIICENCAHQWRSRRD